VEAHSVAGERDAGGGEPRPRGPVGAVRDHVDGAAGELAANSRRTRRRR
jgi:hypothetical protein